MELSRSCKIIRGTARVGLRGARSPKRAPARGALMCRCAAADINGRRRGKAQKNGRENSFATEFCHRRAINLSRDHSLPPCRGPNRTPYRAKVSHNRPAGRRVPRPRFRWTLVNIMELLAKLANSGLLGSFLGKAAAALYEARQPKDV